MAVHDGIICDVCAQCNIVGIRYACLVCTDYDVCEKCYHTRRVNHQHKPYHPVQAILVENELIESLLGVGPEEVRIFCCPYCGDKDLNADGLIQHCRKYHSEGGHPVRCPICLVHKLNLRGLLNTTLLDHSINNHRANCAPMQGPSRSQDTQECSICMEEMTLSNARHLHCGHRFHATCVINWHQSSSSCPLCRTEVDQSAST